MARKKKPAHRPGARPTGRPTGRRVGRRGVERAGGPRPPVPPPAAPARAKAPARTPEELLGAGREALQAGDYAAAVRAWQEVLRARPDPQVRAALAEARFRAALAAQDPSEAIGQLAAAVDLQPDRPALHYHLGLAYLRRNEPQRAAGALRAALDRVPDEPRYRFHLALALLRWGTPDAAGAAWSLIPQQHGPDSHWRCLRAAAYLLRRETDAAYGAAARAPDSGPVADDLALARALVDLGGDAPDHALAALRALAERAPGSPPAAAAAYALGLHAWEAGDAMAAEARWEEAAAAGYPARELEMLRLRALHQTAAAAAQAGRLEEAAQAWERILELRPDDAAARRNVRRARLARADALARSGDIQAAVAAWEEILRAEPDNMDAAHNLALGYERLDRESEALGIWRRIVDSWRKGVRRGEADEETRRRMSLAYRHLGWLYGEAGDFRTAVQELRNALRFDPADTECRMLLAQAYLVQDQYGTARSEVDKILQQDPGNEKALLLSATVARARNDDDGAEAALRALLERNPDHSGARHALANVLFDRAADAHDEGDEEEAKRLVEEQIALIPEDPWPHIQAGRFALENREKRKAAPHFERAAAVGADPETLDNIAREYLYERMVKEARVWLDRSLELDDSLGHYASVVDELAEEHAPWSAVRPYLERAAASDDPSILATLSHAALSAGENATGLRLASRAVELDPQGPFALSALSRAYMAVRDPRGDQALDEAIRQADARGSRRFAAALREHREMLQMAREIEAMGGPSLLGGVRGWSGGAR